MVTKESEKWNTWIAYITATTCAKCMGLNGKIFDKYESIKIPPIYPNCRYKVDRLKAVVAGTVTVKGKNGADWWLYYKKSFREIILLKNGLKNLAGIKQRVILLKLLPVKCLGEICIKIRMKNYRKKREVSDMKQTHIIMRVIVVIIE